MTEEADYPEPFPSTIRFRFTFGKNVDSDTIVKIVLTLQDSLKYFYDKSYVDKTRTPVTIQQILGAISIYLNEQRKNAAAGGVFIAVYVKDLEHTFYNSHVDIFKPGVEFFSFHSHIADVGDIMLNDRFDRVDIKLFRSAMAKAVKKHLG